jgi:prepilin-type N-terminal cleavage/methylation domain-containing protein
MLCKGTPRNKGFTLVELIVVIAIIAILASVSIIGFMRYIENARLSNDNQLAQQMTDFIDYHLLAEGEQDLDAHDVRTIIETGNGGAFDFTPQSKDAGFFFIESSNTVIVHKYGDIIDDGFELAQKETRLLSDATKIDSEIQFGESPEEMFGAGTFLLTTSGSVYADVVDSIRNLADSVNLDSDFTELTEQLSDTFSEYFDLFDPRQGTLYVNDDAWKFVGEDNDPILLKRVIFSNEIRNIPAMNKSVIISGQESGTQIKLPKTVKTIEEHAFTRFFSRVSINLSKTTNLMVEEHAFTSTLRHSLNISETTFPELDVSVTYTHPDNAGGVYESGVLAFYIDGDKQTKLDFDIQGLPRSEITSLQISRSIVGVQSYYTIRAYTKDGLLGKLEIPIEIVEL